MYAWAVCQLWVKRKHERPTPQLESEEHSVRRQEDEAETSTHGEEVIELRTGRYALSPCVIDDGRSHRVGVVESSGEDNRCDLEVSKTRRNEESTHR
jgi:hypothetical protein